MNDLRRVSTIPKDVEAVSLKCVAKTLKESSKISSSIRISAGPLVFQTTSLR